MFWTVQCVQAYDRQSVNNENPKLKWLKMVIWAHRGGGG